MLGFGSTGFGPASSPGTEGQPIGSAHPPALHRASGRIPLFSWGGRAKLQKKGTPRSPTRPGGRCPIGAPPDLSEEGQGTSPPFDDREGTPSAAPRRRSCEQHTGTHRTRARTARRERKTQATRRAPPRAPMRGVHKRVSSRQPQSHLAAIRKSARHGQMPPGQRAEASPKRTHPFVGRQPFPVAPEGCLSNMVTRPPLERQPRNLYITIGTDARPRFQAVCRSTPHHG